MNQMEQLSRVPLTVPITSDNDSASSSLIPDSIMPEQPDSAAPTPSNPLLTALNLMFGPQGAKFKPNRTQRRAWARHIRSQAYKAEQRKLMAPFMKPYREAMRKMRVAAAEALASTTLPNGNPKSAASVDLPRTTPRQLTNHERTLRDRNLRGDAALLTWGPRKKNKYRHLGAQN